MSKTTLIIIGMITFAIIFIVVIYAPKDINSIIGNDLANITFTEVRIKQGNDIEVVSNDIEKIEQLVDHLQSYKFRRTFQKTLPVVEASDYCITLIYDDGYMFIRNIGYRLVSIWLYV